MRQLESDTKRILFLAAVWLLGMLAMAINEARGSTDGWDTGLRLYDLHLARCPGYP